MSSNEEDFNEGESSTGAYQSLKKRRIQRACDICRRKKIRCDGVQMPGNRCSNCIAYNFECTYVEAAKKRGPPKGYVESLENRVEKLDKLLRRLCPDETVYKELNGLLESNNWQVERPPVDPSALVADIASCAPGSTLALESVTSAIRGVSGGNQNEPSDDDENTLILADNLKRLALDPSGYRFFGKSSGAMLIRTAMELKNEYTGSSIRFGDLASPHKLRNVRDEFWGPRPWERLAQTTENPGSVNYVFPEPDLARDLIGLYFKYVNLYLPLLHRPTFEKWVREELYLTNQNFAPVYLLVCAVASRYSEDPRVMLEGYDSYHSCGWKWFDQVQTVNRSILSPPTLFDLQLYCLSVQFLQGSSAPQSCWTLVGIGIRLAQDVGAHRRKLANHTMTPEDELWKRAFWVLICMDRMISSSLGRPCAIQDEDFDLDLPVECDDEYWDHPDPEKQFKQPPGKPSSVTYFVLYLKLHQILAFSLRTIYSINKSKILLGFVGQQWEQHIVAELDSALNKWVDSVPDSLRWDPNREDDDFFNQSVSLYSAYYHIQILIHRPFIPSPSKPSPLSFPSLAICTNAARSCAHVVDIQRRRNPMPPPQIQMAVFTSGIVLLLSIWGGKRSGLSTDPNKEMAEVHKCMQVLRSSEMRWHSAGRLWDILYELASVGDLPLPQPSPPANKRERDSETPISATASESSPSAGSGDMPRNIAGSRRVHHKEASLVPPTTAGGHLQPPGSSSQQQSASRRSSQSHIQPERSAATLNVSPIQYYTLPVYSNELGRLPLHGQVAFSAQAHTQAQATQQPSYWFPMDTNLSGRSGQASEQANVGSSTGPTSASLLPHHLDARQVPQQQLSSQGHIPRNTQLPSGFPPLSEMSTMAPAYNMDAPAIAAGMMFDTMAGTLGYSRPQQQQNVYGIGGMDQSSAMAQPTMQGSFGNVGMDANAMADMGQRAQQQQRLPQMPQMGLQQQQGGGGQQQQDMSYPAFVDSDTIAMWCNAPTGFELDEWGTYLTNVSELTQLGNQGAGSGNQGNLSHLSSSNLSG